VKNSRAHSVFRGKRKLLKNPECKTYIQYSEKFQGNSAFRASASCSKILNVKRIFNTVKNLGHTLLFRASASCSKILNVKHIFNTVKNFRAHCFSGQAQVVKKSWMSNVYSIQWKISGHTVFQGKRKLLKNPECQTYIQYSEKFQGTLFFRASASCSKILNVKRIFNTVKNFSAHCFSGQAQVSQKSWM